MKIRIASFLVVIAVAGMIFMSPGHGDNAKSADEKTTRPENTKPPAKDVEVIPPFVPKKLELKDGELFLYSIKWTGIEAGRSVMKVAGQEDYKGKKVYRLECETRSNAWISKIYPVRDKFISLVDKEGSYSHRFEKALHEGDRHRSIEMDYDYDKKEMRCVKHKRGEEKKHKTVKLKDFSTDPYSCVIYLRHFAGKLEVGKPVYIPVHDDEKNYRLTLNVLRKEKLNLRSTGVRDTFVVEPKASFEGLFVSKGRMLIWLDAETNIILKAEVKIPIGVAKIVLMKADNSPLNNPEKDKK